MRDRQTCIECGKKSPETETNYTLISAQFGWRLARRRDENGGFVVEWRCPDCWRSHKKRAQDDGPPPPSTAAVRPAAGTPPPATRAVSPGTSSGTARTSNRPPAPRTPSRPPSSAPASVTPRTKRP
jgi:hypothetical protein